MKGRLIDIAQGVNRKWRVLVELDEDFRDGFERLKDFPVAVSISKFRHKRSKDANAYFHVLVNKIAAARGVGDTEVKVQLVTEYGVIDRDEDNRKVAFKLPASVDATKYYPYARMYKSMEENGLLVKCWLVYKPTHEMDSAEMARLIDGAIKEARELRIETDTPQQLSRYKEDWVNAQKG